MKAKFLLLSALLAGAPLAAAPVAQLTPIHAQPDANSAVIGLIQPGAEPAPATPATPAPDGWMAVVLPGPHQGYVQDKHVDKGLMIDPGSPIYTEPSITAPVLTVIAQGDKTDITGLHGDWVQISLAKTIVGYIQTGSGAIAQATLADQSAAVAAAVTTPPPAPVTGPGRPVDVGNTAGLPRLFQGTFDTAHGIFTKAPYPYQLKDSTGDRIAYLDLSQLLLTDRIENYIGRTVAVSGIAHDLADGKGVVLVVQSLQLR